MLKNLNHRSNITISLFIAVTIIIGFFIFISNRNRTQVGEIESDQSQSAKTTKLIIKDVEILVEIANEPGEISQGLSGRNSLGEFDGMYFVLGERKVTTFWMKDMKFPLDIIWIDNGEIVYVVENAPVPNKSTPSFTPTQPATHVLEVNADFVKKHSIRVGDIVKTNHN